MGRLARLGGPIPVAGGPFVAALNLVPCPDGSSYYCPDTSTPDYVGGYNAPLMDTPIQPINPLPLPKQTLSCPHGCIPGITCPYGCKGQQGSKGMSGVALADRRGGMAGVLLSDRHSSEGMSGVALSDRRGMSGVLLSDIKKRKQQTPKTRGINGLADLREASLGDTRNSLFTTRDLLPVYRGGLGDLPIGFVQAGTRIHFEATAGIDVFSDLSSLSSCLAGTLGPALVAPQIGFNTPLFGTPKLLVDGTTGFDRNSINDIQGDIINQAQQCGVYLSSPAISIVSTPSGQVPAGVPTSPGQSPGQAIPSSTPSSTPGPCDSKSGLDWFSCSLGMNTGQLTGIGLGSIAIVGLVALLILSRR